MGSTEFPRPHLVLLVHMVRHSGPAAKHSCVATGRRCHDYCLHCPALSWWDINSGQGYCDLVVVVNMLQRETLIHQETLGVQELLERGGSSLIWGAKVTQKILFQGWAWSPWPMYQQVSVANDASFVDQEQILDQGIKNYRCELLLVHSQRFLGLRDAIRVPMPCDQTGDFLTEIMGKPTLRAQPGSVMTSGMQLTISCEGTSSAQEYYLYKEGSPDPWQRQSPLEHGNQAEFFFPSFHPNDAGRYRCYYRTHTGWSERSDFLDLMVTGKWKPSFSIPRFCPQESIFPLLWKVLILEGKSQGAGSFNRMPSSSLGLYRKPSLSALPSPVVRFGGNVTLECISQLGYDGFSLTKEEQQKISWTLDSQYIYSKNNFRALFSVGPLTSGHRRTFRCYGYYLNKSQVWSEASDPLELLVSGEEAQLVYWKIVHSTKYLGIWDSENPIDTKHEDNRTQDNETERGYWEWNMSCLEDGWVFLLL